jgi:hypothetical protein
MVKEIIKIELRKDRDEYARIFGDKFVEKNPNLEIHINGNNEELKNTMI